MYASTLFVLSFVCLMFGAINAAVIPRRNADSNIIRISKIHSPRDVALVKRKNELLSKTDDGILGNLGGSVGRVLSPILLNIDKGLHGSGSASRS